MARNTKVCSSSFEQSNNDKKCLILMINALLIYYQFINLIEKGVHWYTKKTVCFLDYVIKSSLIKEGDMIYLIIKYKRELIIYLVVIMIL